MFLSLTWDVWLNTNITGQFRGRDGVDWPRFFSSGLLEIWRMRNEHVFNGKPHEADRIWSLLHSLGMEQTVARVSSNTTALNVLQGDRRGVFEVLPSRCVDTGWIKPDTNWIKANVDGALSNNHQASCCGVLRDARGAWLRGFSWNLGVLATANVFLVELLAVKIAVETTIALDLSKVIVEFDSLEVINLLHSTNLEEHLYAQVVEDIFHLQQAQGAIVFQHTPQEANTLADYLAKIGLDLHYGAHSFESPFGECHSILAKDLGPRSPPSFISSQP